MNTELFETNISMLILLSRLIMIVDGSIVDKFILNRPVPLSTHLAHSLATKYLKRFISMFPIPNLKT